MRKLIACVVFCLFETYVVYADARSLDSHQYLDLPVLPLQQALIEFSLQTNSTVVAKFDDVEGYYSSPIVGPFKVFEALKFITSKAPLAVTYVAANDSYVLHLRENSTLVEPSDAKGGDYSAAIDEVVVTGQSMPSRYSMLMRSVTQNGVSFFDSSRFHNSFSQKLIADINSHSVVDLLEYSGGVVRASGFGSTNDDYYVRGYKRQNLYVDGFRLSERTAMRLMPESLDKVELLKGPSMLFYGQSGAGGVVNVTRVSPEQDSFTQAYAQAGGAGNSKSTIDVNRGDTAGHPLSYRMITSHETREDAELYRSQVRTDSLLGIKSYWSDQVQIQGSYHWQKYVHADSRDVFSLDSVGEFFSKSDINLLDATSDFESRAQLLNFSMNYYPSSRWRLSASYQWQEERRLGLRYDENLINESDVLIERGGQIGELERFGVTQHMIVSTETLPCGSAICSKINGVVAAVDQDEYETDISLRLSLAGNFNWFSKEHKLVAGADFYHQDLYQNFELLTFSDLLFAEDLIVGEADQHQFAHYWSDHIARKVGGATKLKEYRILRDDYGIYSQLHSYWSPKWSTSIGWRYSYFDGEQRDITRQQKGLMSDASDISPQLGLVFQPTEDASLFANYSESVAIRYLIDDDNRFVDRPEVARQWEMGVKWLAWSGKLSTALALFDIRKSNAHRVELVDSRRHLIGPYNENVAGVESDVSVSLSDSWQFIAHLSLLDSKIDRNKSITTPLHTADINWSFFTRKQWTSMWQSTLGIRSLSDRSLDYDESINVPGYTVVDASIVKSLKVGATQVEAKLLIDNVFDEQYYKSAQLNGYAEASEGRTFRFRVSVSGR